MSHWNINSLSRDARYRVVSTDGPIQEILFEGEPFLGKPTEVSAYIGVPAGNGPVPGMVCVHGGGGKAFRQWVEMWVARGYAAIAMDLNGCDGSGKRLANGGPEMNHEAQFDTALAWEDLWTYHAVAATMRAGSILSSHPAVDGARMGITGISWGGYVTCIAAGLDRRFGCAIPVYGCGFLQENSAEDWLKIFAEMSSEERQTWHDRCDPSIYLGRAEMPMLFVSGTNDAAYPLDSLEKSCALPRDVTRCVRHEMGHSHEHGWAPGEIALFADQHLQNGTPLPRIDRSLRVDGRVRSEYAGTCAASKGYLLYTTCKGTWQDRKWHKGPATVTDSIVEAKLPDDVSAYFLAIEDERGAYVSSPLNLR
ncbi:MAG: prolyl oligopeptidase family serine peptidase [Verrucomicrobia bacterium]|jgi:dienelactone hydrolase|nr:prolyl oligopeptidase family serine peptidase [Verrucomicrobiota bacterium]MBT7066484.1 prolyl oligopeptidase family serine peptidase [Verrucomicrobiota bacterium]MBT7698960.1 prolyl oligopeptidase family serine peptidase [Verrucomicrobiota bacterium]